MMTTPDSYPIGTPGKKWDMDDKASWRAAQSVKRSYADQVIAKINALAVDFDVERIGALSYDPDRYPLFAVKSLNWDAQRPNVLITGGVHGYETSGVQGAIRFLQKRAPSLAGHFNLLVLPCVSPWGYETINRWNPLTLDPNRSFFAGTPCEEAAAVMTYLESFGVEFIAHFDLHETTDTDNTEFRPALTARDATTQEVWDIPDGFYTVGDSARQEPEFQAAIIESVETVTHIAPDMDGKIIGEPLQQWGVIDYDAGPLGLCMGVTKSKYVTTTEVYPDSPKVDDENCTEAQVAAVMGGLQFITDLLHSDQSK